MVIRINLKIFEKKQKTIFVLKICIVEIYI